MSTLPLCCDLHALIIRANEPIQSGLVWHVFSQLYHALYFLQKVCGPWIDHRDLNTVNVLIGYNDRDSQDLPEVMIIDFGSASDDGKGNSSGEMFDGVAELAQESSGSDMEAFVSAWSDDDLGVQGLNATWEAFGQVAKESVAALSSTDKQNIPVVVLDAITAVAEQGDGSGNVRADVAKLLRKEICTSH